MLRMDGPTQKSFDHGKISVVKVIVPSQAFFSNFIQPSLFSFIGKIATLLECGPA